MIHSSLGMVYAALHRFEEAERELGLAHALQIRGEDREGLAYVLLHSGNLLYKQGRHEEAIARLRESRQIFASLDNMLGVANVEVDLGDCLIRQGDYEEADHCLNHSLQVATEISHFQIQMHALQYLARLSVVRNQLERATTYFHEAFTLGVRIGDRMHLTCILADEIMLDYSTLLRGKGDPSAAYRLLCIAVREFAGMGLPEAHTLAERQREWRAELPDADDIGRAADATPLAEALRELIIAAPPLPSRYN
jgi:tetratricopeptide (TPR) repeat protein